MFDHSYISEMNKKLEDFRSLFLSQTNLFISDVKVSTERFTDQDRIDFNAILTEIRQFAMTKISDFINTRIQTKATSFTSFFENYDQNTDILSNNLDIYKTQLEEASRKLKESEIESQKLLQKITQKYARIQTLKKGFKAFKSNAEQKLKNKKEELKMKNFYETKLKKKCFFPWRTLTYKEGYQKTIKRESEKQFRTIHSQFGKIVQVLRQKIMQAEEMIKIRRASKSQFAYALSKNLLKTISNLSLQVMSLNQIASKDIQKQHETQQFLNQVNHTIKNKLSAITLYKQTIRQTHVPVSPKRKIQIQEPRQIPQRVLSPKSKSKKISFA